MKTDDRPICPASGQPALITLPRTEDGRIYCPECGKLVTVTSWKLIRRHVDGLS